MQMQNIYKQTNKKYFAFLNIFLKIECCQTSGAMLNMNEGEK